MGEASAIAGVSPSTLRGWIQRGVVDVSPFHKGGTGNKRLYSPFDIARIATIVQIHKFGVSPTVANALIVDSEFEWCFESVKKSVDDDKSRSGRILAFIAGELGTHAIEYYICEKDGLAAVKDKRIGSFKDQRAVFIVRIGDIIRGVLEACAGYRNAA